MKAFMWIAAAVAMIMALFGHYLWFQLMGDLDKPAIVVAPQLILSATMVGFGWLTAVVAVGFLSLLREKGLAEPAGVYRPVVRVEPHVSA